MNVEVGCTAVVVPTVVVPEGVPAVVPVVVVADVFPVVDVPEVVPDVVPLVVTDVVPLVPVVAFAG